MPDDDFFMFFVPCIVMQLCNVNQLMHAFQINGLIHFLASSTCFEHHVFIRMTICTCSFVWFYVLIRSFHLLDCLHQCIKNKPYKNAYTDVLLDDEQMMYETRGRH